MIECLVRRGAELDEVPSNSWENSLTPLAFAAHKGNIVMMKLFLNLGLCPANEETDDGVSPLLDA